MSTTLHTRIPQTGLPRPLVNGVSQPNSKPKTMWEITQQMARNNTRLAKYAKANNLSRVPAAIEAPATETKTVSRNNQRLPGPQVATRPSTPAKPTVCSSIGTSEVRYTRMLRLGDLTRVSDARRVQTPPSSPQVAVKTQANRCDKTYNIEQEVDSESFESGCINLKGDQAESKQPSQRSKVSQNTLSAKSDNSVSACHFDDCSSEDEDPIFDNPSAVSNKSSSTSPKPKPKLTQGNCTRDCRRSNERGIAVPTGKTLDQIMDRRARAQKKPAYRSPKSQVMKFLKV